MNYLRAFLLTLLLPSLVWASGSEQTINTLPTNGSSFLTSLQTFLKREDAQRFALQFSGFVLSGGIHAAVPSLTATPTSMTAFPGGHYTTEIGSITYANNETTWVIAHKDVSGNLNNFVRVPGTHYLIDSTSSSKPSLPSDSVWLMEVTTSGGSVTAVLDLRTRNASVPSFTTAELLARPIVRGQLAISMQTATGFDTLYYADAEGSTWHKVMRNPMTTFGQIIFSVTGGEPLALSRGTANQVLGMTDPPNEPEYKTLVAGSGMSITHGTGTVTFAQTGVSPPGAIMFYAGTSAPSGWLLCNGAAYDNDTHPDLFDVYVPNASAWGFPTAVGSFTVNTGTDTVTLAGHGLADGERVHVASTVTLPAGLTANTKYFVINSTTDTLKLSLTLAGAAVDITTAGSGTQFLYDGFLVPNALERTAVGAGAATKDFLIEAIDTGTDTFIIPSNTTLYTGDTVIYDTTGAVATGLTDAATYYVIRDSATDVRLATSQANALVGTAIDISGVGTGTQVLRQTLTTRTIAQHGGTENSSTHQHTHVLTDPGHTHTQRVRNASAGATQVTLGSTTGTGANDTNAGATASNTTGMTINTVGGTGVGANMPPFIVFTWIIKT